MNAKMRNERLLEVVRVLRELPRGKRFDIERWYTCGTVGCAVGWAASDPWFNRRGLKIELDDEPFDGKISGTPVYRGYTSMRAATEFFEIGYEDAEDLFLPGAYGRTMLNPGVKVPRAKVIRRIKRYVREHPA